MRDPSPAPVSGSSAEQPREQRDQHEADQGDAAAGHELLDPLRLGAGVVVSVALEKVDGSPYGEARAEGDNEGLEDLNCGVEKIHTLYAGIIRRSRRLLSL